MNYRVLPLNPIRALITDQMSLAREKNNIHGLFELDITFLKSKLKQQREQGKVFSYAAYLIFCLGQSLENHKEMLDMRWGKRKKVAFDTIDLFTIVERREKGKQSLPLGLIIHDIGSKTLEQINQELRHAQKADPLSLEGVAERRKIMRYPAFIRRLTLWYIHRNPTLFVKYYGNVGLTSLNFFTDNRVWYGIPLVAVPLCLVPAGSYKKVVMVDGKIEEHDFSSFTFTVNHDLNDGSPAVRFAREFAEKVEGAYGL